MLVSSLRRGKKCLAFLALEVIYESTQLVKGRFSGHESELNVCKTKSFSLNYGIILRRTRRCRILIMPFKSENGLTSSFPGSKFPEVIVLLNALAMKGTSSGSSYLQFSYDIESGPGLFRFCWDCITMFQSMMEK